MAMASQNNHHLNFLIVPLMSQSHLIPMTDFAKLLALRGLTVTIITTPLNAARYKPLVDRAAKSGLKIKLLPVRFPCQEAGLPEGCENMDTLTSPDHVAKFFEASGLLQQPLERLVAALEPPPCCLITSNALPWTAETSRKFNIPRYDFNAVSCFTLLCSRLISSKKDSDSDADADTESISVPGMPQSFEFRKTQLPCHLSKDSSQLDSVLDLIKAAQASARGVLINTFEEMETTFVEEFKKLATGQQKTWCIGPVSLCNREIADKFNRGNKASIDENDCIKWLDSKKPSSVVYACFGSLCHISAPQLIEIGLGLEQSGRSFIWVVRGADCSEEIEKWLEQERFVERNHERGLVIRGWAPQVLILSHPAVGGFLTHCGWNSTLEGVSAGVPVITWPMFAEQFYNEKLVTEVLRIGVRIGVEVGMKWGEEESDYGVLVKREGVKRAAEALMNDGEEGEGRRRRARELGEMAKRAVVEGGSSYLNISLLIQDVVQQNQAQGFVLLGDSLVVSLAM